MFLNHCKVCTAYTGFFCLQLVLIPITLSLKYSYIYIYFLHRHMRSVMSTTFSLQILSSKLLLVLIWTHHLNSPHEGDQGHAQITQYTTTLELSLSLSIYIYIYIYIYISNFLKHNQIYTKNHSLTLITIHDKYVTSFFKWFFFLELCYPLPGAVWGALDQVRICLQWWQRPL